MGINFRSNTRVSNLRVGPSIASPVVTLASNQTEINESGTVVFSITTENIEAGTLVPYSISGVTSTDIAPSPLSGNFVIGTTESISITAVNDEDTDGDKTMVITLPSNDNLTASCIVRDTSQTPPPIISSYLAVGAPQVNSRTGAAYVFDATDYTATPTKLVPSGLEASDQFGYSIAATANQIVVAAPFDDDQGDNTGAVYVYDANNLSATPTKLAPSGLDPVDLFGNSVTATANQIVVGTSRDDDQGTNAGAVYVYDANNLSATPTKLVPSGLGEYDTFGVSVTATANQIVVGARGDDDQGENAGAVYVYDATNLSATPTKLAPSGLDAGDYFGMSVAATSNQIVVGAYQDDDRGDAAGAVYVYDATNLSATPTKLAPSGLDAGDYFGMSVAVTANQIVVGAFADDDQGNGAGAVYVYDATNLSATPTKLAPSGLGSGDSFGYSVTATTNQIVVAAQYDDDQGENAGAVYVYDATNLSATPTKLAPSDLAAGAEFGSSVSLG